MYLAGILEFFFFTFPKNGSVGRWETKHLMGWPNQDDVGDRETFYSWVSRDVTSFAQISVRHVGVPRVSNLY